MERFLFNGIHAEAAGPAEGRENHAAAAPLPHGAPAALSLLQGATMGADIAAKPAIPEPMPVTGGVGGSRSLEPPVARPRGVVVPGLRGESPGADAR